MKEQWIHIREDLFHLIWFRGLQVHKFILNSKVLMRMKNNKSGIQIKIFKIE